MYLVACTMYRVVKQGIVAALRAAIPHKLSKGLALAVTAAILAACAPLTARSKSFGSAQYVTPILAAHTMPEELGRTRCSINNLPIIEIDSVVLERYPINEAVRRHELKHAERALAYKGGCWAYMYRIQGDKKFRVQEQLLAYCAGAEALLERNADPRQVWNMIQSSMVIDTVLTEQDNCVYKPW